MNRGYKPMHNTMMDGFTRDDITSAKHLKDMIISQLKARHELGKGDFGDFDVVHYKEGDTYYAQAILHSYRYDHEDYNGHRVKHRAWTQVAYMGSKEGILGALESPWNTLQNTLPDHMKRKYSLDRSVLRY